MTRATSGMTGARGTPPPGAWHGPPERPQPVRDRGTWSWTLQPDAACRNLGGSLFFAPDGERTAARRRREAAAKAVCARCPVQMPCALYALATAQPYGVWGGLTEDDRQPAAAHERRRTRVPRRRLHRVRR
jgi:WhiB family transcriptional regulator, redox-sensing transcriptional regulator